MTANIGIGTANNNSTSVETPKHSSGTALISCATNPAIQASDIVLFPPFCCNYFSGN